MTKAIILFVSLLLLARLGRGQEGTIVPGRGTRSPLPATRAGTIVFSAEKIMPDSVAENTFLTSYRLTPKSELYFTAFLQQPLTRSLQALAPDMPAQEVTGLGNFHFSFYVDSKLVYQEPLHPGAGSAQQKGEQAIVSRPLTTRASVNWWSEFLWHRFLRNGGDSAFTEGKHLFRMEIRPYVQQGGVKLGEVIAAGEIPLKIHKPKIDPATVPLSKPLPYNGLAVSTESFDRARIRALKAKEAENEFRNLTSIVVLKNGKLLIEEYFNNADRSTLHDVRSVGKTFASTISGIAIGEGHLKSEDQALHEFYDLRNYAHYDPAKEKTTLKELLTMSSVFEGDDSNPKSAGNEENMYPTADWVKFTLDLPVDTAYASGKWHYFTAGVVLLGDILHQSVPGGLEAYADRKLFQPLGITDYKWQHTPQKVANTAGGIRMNALDFAKFAQLYQNGGAWNGKQVLPRQWVNKSFTRHKAIPGRQNEYYGYLFWNKTFRVKGKDYEAFYCAGNGGNHLYVFRDLPVVVVVTATAYNRFYGHAQVHTMLEEYLLPALTVAR